MTLVVSIAAGYLLGRVLASLGNTMLKVILRRLFEASPRWRALVRQSVARDSKLRATLVGPWVTRNR